MIFPIKRLADLGFEIVATAGTGEVLRRHGIACEIVPQALRGAGDGPRRGVADRAPARWRWSSTRRRARARRPLRRVRDPQRRRRRRHPVHHHRAGRGRGGDGHRGADPRRHDRPPAAGTLHAATPAGTRAESAVTVTCSSGRSGRCCSGSAAATPRRRTSGRCAGSPALPPVARRAAAPRATRCARRRRCSGCDFPNPVGLAAGMDKNGVALPAWPALGFGFVEVGTVTAHAQPGNPRPRLFRLPRQRGGRSTGWASTTPARAALAGPAGGAAAPLGVPLGISLGKSKVTPLEEAVEDYLAVATSCCARTATTSRSTSPRRTRPGLRALQDRGAPRRAARPRWCGGRQPVLVKIAPDLTERGHRRAAGGVPRAAARPG